MCDFLIFREMVRHMKMFNSTHLTQKHWYGARMMLKRVGVGGQDQTPHQVTFH